MGKVTRNLLANYLGAAWTGLMGVAFIPLYVHFLGMEAYGVIGVFAVLQAVFVVLDMGMAPTLSREAARFQAGAHSPQEIRELVHAVERVYGVIALVSRESGSCFALARRRTGCGRRPWRPPRSPSP